MTGISADQAPTRSGAAQTIEPQEARDSTEVTICDIDTIVDFDIEPISVSINVRNGVTGSLVDPATTALEAIFSLVSKYKSVMLYNFYPSDLSVFLSVCLCVS